MAGFTHILSVICAIILALVTGVTLGHFRLPPEPQLAQAIDTLRIVRREGLAMIGVRPVQHLEPLTFPLDHRPRFDPARSQPGVTLLVSIFDGRLTARLYGNDGQLRHDWPVDFFKIRSEGKAHRFQALIHGAALLSNGDLLANLDGRGTYRISPCGDVVWKNESRAHHALSLDGNGGFWTPIYVDRYEPSSLVAARDGFNFDAIARFDLETGEQTDVIDLVKILLDGQLEGVIGQMPIADDVSHLNDIETLSEDMEDAFPGFAAGDILLSFRRFNQIWVLDGTSHTLKWYMTGPMRSQHDPDFQSDGTITVFDNRTDLRTTETKASRILKIDPVTRRVATIIDGNGVEHFYTAFRGKHQVLSNGNLLLAETDRGRAFEVTPDGDVVWEYISKYDENSVAWMMDAIRYPDTYGKLFDEIACQ